MQKTPPSKPKTLWVRSRPQIKLVDIQPASQSEVSKIYLKGLKVAIFLITRSTDIYLVNWKRYPAVSRYTGTWYLYSWIKQLRTFHVGHWNFRRLFLVDTRKNAIRETCDQVIRGEPRKENSRILLMKYWLIPRDPYFMIYEIIPT